MDKRRNRYNSSSKTLLLYILPLMNRQEIINGLVRKSRSRICSLILSLSGCLLFAALLVLFDVNDSESRQLFRVTLRPSAANLVDGVEKIFGEAMVRKKVNWAAITVWCELKMMGRR